MPGAAAAAKPAAGQQPLRDGRDVNAQPRKPTTAWGDGVVHTKGRVLTPDGKPIAAHQITLWWYAVIGPGWHHHTFQEARPRVLATTGPDGTFEASFPKSVMANAYSTTQTQRPWSWAEIVAGTDGYGPALSWAGGETNVYELKLVPDDVPVRGRVIDLQGQPVSGVSVWVQEMHDSQRITRSPSWKGLSTDLKTDNDGRFVLRGIGRDRSVTLHIGGPTVAHQMLEVSTQKVVGGKPIDHKDVEIVAGPSKPIHGVVRAADSGQPVPGVWIYGDEINDVNIRGIRAKSDAQGRFHLEAMPKTRFLLAQRLPA